MINRAIVRKAATATDTTEATKATATDTDTWPR